MTWGTKKGGAWWALLGVAVLAGAALRVLFILRGRIDSDEAIVGLMGMEILKGHHFAFYWGQAYMGTLEPYTAALLFRIFGVSPEILKAVPVLYFLAAAGFHYLFARRILGRNTAAVLLGLLFWSPWVFSRWGAAPRGGYMEAIALGGLVLYLASLIAGREGRASAWWYLLLGLAGGLGFWTNYLFVYYLVPVGLVILLPALGAQGRWQRAGGFTAGFLTGLSPALAYNILHSFASLKLSRMGGTLDVSSNWENLSVRQLPTLLGANCLDTPRPLWPWASWALLGLYALAVAWFLIAAARRARRPQKTPAAAAYLPVLTVATGLACFVFTGFGSFDTERYLLPLYPLFALFLAVLLADLGGLWKPLAVAAGLFIASVNAYGNWVYVTRNTLPRGEAFNRETAQVLSYCREEGIRTAWAGHWISYLLTFMSREELVVGDTDRDRYPAFQQLAADDPRPSLISQGYTRQITETLKAAGYRFEVRSFPQYSVFGRLETDPAVGAEGERMEARVVAYPPGDFGPESGGAIRSREAQRAGTEVTFGLGGARRVNGFILAPGERPLEYPRNFVLETSPDGLNWETAVRAEPYVGGIYRLGRFQVSRNGWVTLWFPPRKVSLLRVRLTDKREDRRWTVDKAWVSLVSGEGVREGAPKP